MRVEKNCKQLEKIKNIGIVLKPNSPELKNTFLDIKKLFLKNNINIILEEKSANMIGEFGRDFDDLCKEADFLISVGGDGTLLGVARKAFLYDLPVLGINLGTLGFLTDLNIDDLEDFIKDLLTKDYKISPRMIIEGKIENKNFIAFNDIVISRKNLSSMLEISAKIDKKPFNKYFGDGLIVCTPSGSTAYNLSVGGPIVYPLTNAFIITPIAPHSLTQRPIVVPADFEIEFKVPFDEATIIVDGQEFYELKKGEYISIKIAKKQAKMLHRTSRDFFEVLSEKLRWGNLI
ncbi:putative inorganic polyphosphate/ATP-NAD kinase [Aliarcobacter thereius]|uniref:NAD kinase n=2 Tax=Aliarcobacter thereius TaxID=544718 RepID=A0A1C0B9A2_9BACT|nr:NAD(+)/NADH kinase [Aliarcobacter thereius]OCL88704.1 putative inorganic polyphosphate/ATP-NAD kinase [Aliarcobacter thereius]OCL94705.1 putative inorganic polyphosphate/ATP-NAD kinase [Aliarcobacter thereius LMG 24486]OCM00151.1 putative inorganic polyphosphate/ATP-NAD kinase [Aliarcobacter thereius]QBF15419.1 inorganic polyphosphate/ATP-NAD kinase [Aliarcobacter thereius LMG 24486]TLS72360.1 NAD(+) kinase [Aliarcobacter thereius]